MEIKVQTIAKISIDQDLCIKCGICVEVCPFGLIQKTSDHRYIIPHPELCTECSACKKNCPVDAILLIEQKGCGCLWNVKARKKGIGNCGDSDQDKSCCC